MAIDIYWILLENKKQYQVRPKNWVKLNLIPWMIVSGKNILLLTHARPLQTWFGLDFL